MDAVKDAIWTQYGGSHGRSLYVVMDVVTCSLNVVTDTVVGALVTAVINILFPFRVKGLRLVFIFPGNPRRLGVSLSPDRYQEVGKCCPRFFRHYSRKWKVSQNNETCNCYMDAHELMLRRSKYMCSCSCY